MINQIQPQSDSNKVNIPNWLIGVVVIIALVLVIVIIRVTVTPKQAVSTLADNTLCRNIVPDRIKLNELPAREGVYYSYVIDANTTEKRSINYYWKDGVKIQTLLPQFLQGSKEGQNINYYYTKDPILYEKQNVSETGVIGPKIYMTIDLAINSKNQTDAGYLVKQYRCCLGKCGLNNKGYSVK